LSGCGKIFNLKKDHNLCPDKGFESFIIFLSGKLPERKIKEKKL